MPAAFASGGYSGRPGDPINSGGTSSSLTGRGLFSAGFGGGGGGGAGASTTAFCGPPVPSPPPFSYGSPPPLAGFASFSSTLSFDMVVGVSSLGSRGPGFGAWG